MYHADLYRGSVDLHFNKPKQTANERDRLISCDYLRLSFRQNNGYLRKQVVVSKESEIPVWASMLCWSTELFKVTLSVNIISTACVIKIDWSLHISLNETVLLNLQLNERLKTLKDSLLSPPCSVEMKLHWLTARLEHVWNINRKRIRTNSYIG